MATGAGKLTCCQPKLDSPVKVAVASSWPAEFHRCAVCVPVLALPLKKRAPVTLPPEELRNFVPTSIAAVSGSEDIDGEADALQIEHGQLLDDVAKVHE